MRISLAISLLLLYIVAIAIVVLTFHDQGIVGKCNDIKNLEFAYIDKLIISSLFFRLV